MKLEQLNLQNPISIGYYDPFSVFPLIQAELESKLPLSNLHWKYHPLKPVKLIPLLPAKLVEEVPGKSTPQLVNNTYLRLIVVKADLLTTYRSQTRPLIRAWLEKLVDPNDAKHAILYVSSGKELALLMKKSVYEKLVTDFGQDEDVVFRVSDSFPDDLERMQSWNYVVGCFKTLILGSFLDRHAKLTEELEVISMAKEHDPENAIRELLCQLKLAYALSDMRFFDEALQNYENLEYLLRKAAKKLPHAFKKAEFTPRGCDSPNFDPELLLDKNGLAEQLDSYVKNGTQVDIAFTELSVFLCTALLLQLMANFALLILVLALHLLTLHEKLVRFVHALCLTYSEDPVVLQWCCALVDHFLQLPLVQSLKELAQINEAENPNLVLPVSSIAERTGELKLLRRSLLNRLAQNAGLSAPSTALLSEISLETPKKLECVYSPVFELLELQEKYENAYEQLTEEALAEFVGCGRSKTVDLLSIDVAAIHYKKGDYMHAFELLLESYEYFLAGGWRFMGGMLLEMYFGCVDKLENSDSKQIVGTDLKMLSLLRAGPDKAGINSYAPAEGKQKLIFQHALESAEKLENSLVVPLDELLEAEIVPLIEPAEFGTFAVLLKVTNSVGISLEFSEVSVELTEEDTLAEPTVVRFSAENVVLPSGTSTLKVFCSEFKNAIFSPTELTFQASKKLVFSRTFGLEPDQTVVHFGEIAEKEQKTPVPLLKMYNSPEFFRAFFRMPEQIELGAHCVELVVENGKCDISDISLKLSLALADVSFDETELSLGLMEASQETTRRIPYSYYGEVRSIGFVAEIRFKSEHKSHVFHAANDVDNHLMVLISVQDIFRADAIYLKFQVGCAQPKFPIRITDAQFECQNEKYEILTLSCLISEEDSQVVFGEQPCFFFYKIKPTGLVSASDNLDLTISFSCLQDECVQFFRDFLRENLQKNNLHQYVCLAEELLGDLAFDLNEYAVGGLVTVLNAVECAEKLSKLISGAITCGDTRASLVNVFSETTKTAISEENNSKVRRQRLYIPVAVPVLDLLHNVSFNFEQKPQYPVGEPISVKFSIQTLTKWRDAEVLASSLPQPKKKPTLRGFQYTIHHEENWLLTGPKRQFFQLDPNELASENSFELSLVPLNVGKLQLPRVSVKSVDLLERENSADTVHLNGLETVLVVPELHSMTFTF